MTLAMRCSLSRLRDALRHGSVVRVTVAVLSIAATAMIVTAVTPGVSAANQTDWSSPQNVDGTNRLVSTSCASPLFCVAVDLSGNVLTYNGSSWSAPDMITDADLFSVSCPSAKFCVAVGGDGIESSWNGSSWSAPGPVGSEIYDLLSVSCTSSNFCAAVDDNGGVDTWNGSSWTGPTGIDRGVQLDSVSCVSPSFCVAVDNQGTP